MSQRDDYSITAVRTFDMDVLRAHGEPQDHISPSKKTKTSPRVTTETKKETSTTPIKKAIASDLSALTYVAEHSKTQAPKKSPSKRIVAKKPPKKEAVRDTPHVRSLDSRINAGDLINDVEKVERAPRSSRLADETQIHNIDDEHDFESGTIIRERKRRTFHLLPAIGVALKQWFGTQQETVQHLKEPKHTVAKAESRIDTLTAAAQHSYHAPQSDHGIAIKRLTQTKRPSVTAAPAIVKREDVTQPSWTHVTEENSEQVVEKLPTQVPVRETNTVHETSDITVDTLTTDQPTETIPEKQDVDTVLQKRIITSTEPQWHQTNEPYKNTSDVPATTQRPIIENTRKPLLPEDVSEPVAPVVPKQVSQKKRSYRATPDTTPSRAPIPIFMLVILGASFLGVGTSLYWFYSSTPTEEATIIRIPSLIQTKTTVPVTLAQSRERTYAAIIDAAIHNRETVQIYPVLKDTAGNNIPADAQTILAALQLRAPGSFTRSISDITFGSFNGTEPFVLMKVRDFDTAFAGMLAWEKTLSEDMSPLLGSPVSQSFDQYARNDTQLRDAFYKDGIVANKSVRTLVGPSNEERIVYSFITPTHILITTDSTTLRELIPLVKE